MKAGEPAGSFKSAWGGIASLSLGPSILWTHAQHHGLTLGDLARLMSSAPAALAGLEGRKGRIAEGFDADFTVFAPEESFTVTPAHLHFLHPVSPYVGGRLTGVVKQTILRGRTVFENGRFPREPFGLEVRP